MRARAAAEIAFVVLCVLIAEWAVIPIFGRRKSIGMIPILMVFLFGFLSHRVRGETAREIGFTGRNFGSAFRLLVVWMAPAAGTLLGVGWLVGSLHFNPPRDWAILVQRQLWLHHPNVTLSRQAFIGVGGPGHIGKLKAEAGSHESMIHSLE